MSSVTVVTGLFDLAKYEKSVRQNPNDYLKWGYPLLKSDVNLVIYCDPHLVNAIENIRFYPKNNLVAKTKIIPIPFGLLYHRVKRVHAIKKEQDLKYPRSPSDMNKDTGNYLILTWSKISFLEEVMLDNPFNSSHFCWFDFGLMHVTDWSKYRSLGSIISTLTEVNPDKLHVTWLSEFPEQQFKEDEMSYWAIFSGVCAGGIFGGPSKEIIWLADTFWKQINLLMERNIVTWEERILAFFAYNYPEKFSYWFGGYYSIGINWGEITLYNDYLKNLLSCFRNMGGYFPSFLGYSLGQQLISYIEKTSNIPILDQILIYDNAYICCWYAHPHNIEKRMKQCTDIGQKLLKLAETNPKFRHECQLQKEHLNNNLRFVNLSLN